MRTVLKYNDGTNLDFAVNETQKAEFREIVRQLNYETSEDWSGCLESIEVDGFDTDTHEFIYNGSTYEPTEHPHGNGFYRRKA